MAENTDEAQETDAAEKPSKGLSTSLLIKVAIGLSVVLIALIVAFFMMPKESVEQTESELETPIEEQVEIEDTETADAETDSIALPDIEEDANTAPETPAVDAEQSATPTTPASDNVLSEIMALQKQIGGLKQENQKLIKQVEQLVKENEKLKTQVSQLTAQRPSLDEVIADEQLVNNTETPAYFRQQRYRNTPQPELEPKWGEFDALEQTE